MSPRGLGRAIRYLFRYRRETGIAYGAMIIATLAQLEHGRFRLDDGVLEPLSTSAGRLDRYLHAARTHRPEVAALGWAVRAGSAAADLEKAKFFPDFLIVAMFNYSVATGVDDPHNAFLDDPFNSIGFGFGLSVRSVECDSLSAGPDSHNMLSSRKLR